MNTVSLVVDCGRVNIVGDSSQPVSAPPRTFLLYYNVGHYETRACALLNTAREVLGTDCVSARSIQKDKLAWKRPKLIWTTASLHTLTADIWEQSQISPDQVAPILPLSFLPWELEKTTVCHSLGDSLTKKWLTLSGNSGNVMSEGAVGKKNTPRSTRSLRPRDLRNGVRPCNPRPTDYLRRYKLPAVIRILTWTLEDEFYDPVKNLL